MKETIIAGLDEAGRGAVLGPLVVAGVAIPAEAEGKLKMLGVRDSKELSPKSRERLAKRIERLGNIVVLKVGPCKIDNYRIEGVNLNKIEAFKFAEITNMLSPHRVYIDAPDVNLSRLRSFLEKMVDGVELVVEHYADRNYPVVSAASIIAKVERDRSVEELRKKHGEIGSGYPSDPVTIEWLKKWLEKNKKLPEIARRTWITAEVLRGESEQKGIAEFIKREMEK